MVKKKILVLLTALMMLLSSSAWAEEAASAVIEGGTAMAQSYVYPNEENPQILELAERAVEYTLDDNHDLALACMELARMIDDQDAIVDTVLCQIYYDMGDLEQARACAVRITELTPTWAVGWSYLLELSGPEEGERILRYLEVLLAATDAHYLHLADGFAGISEYEKAAKYYDKCDLSMLSEEQRKNYCYALLYSGQQDRAVALGLYEASERDAKLMALSMQESVSLKKVDLLEGYTGEGAGIVSLSPDGERVIVTSAEYGWSIWNRSTKTLVPIQPSADKGVADAYGNLEKLLSSATLMREEEFVWSPDGRYAVPVYAKRVFTTLNGVVNPVLIDTFTGEAILTATWSPKLMNRDGSGGTVVHACFSADGRYLYYTFLGGMVENRWRLMRYDLQNAMTEVVFEEDLHPCWCYQGMFETEEGGFATIYSPNAADDHCGLTVYQKESSGWIRNLLSFDLPRGYFTAADLEFDGTSGFGVMKEMAASQKVNSQTQLSENFSFFKTFRLVGSALLEDGYWNLNGAQEPQLQYYTAEEYVRLFSEYPEAQWWMDNWYVHCIRLSPDGYYALIACSKPGSGRLLLYDFEQQTLTPVVCPEEVKPQFMDTALGMKFEPGITWCEDGTLLLLTDTGAQGYRMK